MMFYSPITEVGRTVSDAFAKVGRDDKRISADQADLKGVLLFVAVGLLLTAAFFTLGFGAEVGPILAAYG
jgi:hypothetical protein